jgi:hypothetical protein
MSALDLMNKQLTQVFQYAEMLVRLNSVQELLDVEGGYIGEREINESIEKLKIEIRQNIEQHLLNSGVSNRAKIIINNADFLRVHKNLKTCELCGKEKYYNEGTINRDCGRFVCYDCQDE